MDSARQGDETDDPIQRESQIDQILRRKRKARKARVCYPCRQRKVKCDYGTPCQRCIDREHPELCSYQQAPKTRSLDSAFTSSPAEVTRPVAAEGRPPEDKNLWSELESVKALLQDVQGKLQSKTTSQTPAPSNLAEQDTRDVYPTPSGVQAPTELLGDFVHLGRHSVPAMVMALGTRSDEVAVQDIIGKSALPLFGLDNESATYPFVDLWGLPTGSSTRVQEICKIVPSDAECFQFLRQYRDVAHILYPAVVDIDQLEADLTQFLISRSSQQLPIDNYVNASSTVYGKSLHWLSLMFACLASGCQASSLPRKERHLTSQVYVCCAYECLRCVNYLCHPTVLDIQSLLVLGNVIANNMNAGVAWSLLGLTIRLAITIGLHEATDSPDPSTEMHSRRELWWRILWQDSLLSITFDRAPSSFMFASAQSQQRQASAMTDMSYVECMKSLCSTGLHIVQERSISSDLHWEPSNMLKVQEEFADILRHAAPHLRDVTNCRSIRDQLEHWCFDLHISFFTSELFRPLLKHQKPNAEQLIQLRDICIESLAKTVHAFLGLQNVASSVKTSWAVLQKALSSALMLSILQEPLRDKRVKSLLDGFMAVMMDLNSGLGPSELPAPLSRSIAALQRLLALPANSNLSASRIIHHQLEPGQDIEELANKTKSPHSMSSSSQSGGSPYTLRDSILWGGPGHGMTPG
ncbi:hypothetical protein G647_09746 [Cladophialophora carrionii CBS 160.54]|uniref:Zn(2)-C6 fungal-type domain-containing protein n=1 Tax=Cladophialophora carrionii CBS 160.54 TaxID=1279043 RepID=V9DJI7_9EURO|nr:uncharacterized protein G647_09746 [Cladophialophora carrionii CBS 160.54]ETI27064.1 hypothetical protein G647_09746 [Cladophialophora carrionii CBS 160.54]